MYHHLQPLMQFSRLLHLVTCTTASFRMAHGHRREWIPASRHALAYRLGMVVPFVRVQTRRSAPTSRESPLVKAALIVGATTATIIFDRFFLGKMLPPKAAHISRLPLRRYQLPRARARSGVWRAGRVCSRLNERAGSGAPQTSTPLSPSSRTLGPSRTG